MVGVGHRHDARAGEDIGEHLLDLLELRRHLLEQGIVVRVLSRGCRHQRGRRLDASRKEEDEPLPAKLAIDHRLPVADEPLVAAAPRPDIGRAFSLLAIAQEIRAIIRVAEPLHLQPKLVVQTGEQERELILERIECSGAAALRSAGSMTKPFETWQPLRSP